MKNSDKLQIDFERLKNICFPSTRRKKMVNVPSYSDISHLDNNNYIEKEDKITENYQSNIPSYAKREYSYREPPPSKNQKS